MQYVMTSLMLNIDIYSSDFTELTIESVMTFNYLGRLYVSLSVELKKISNDF